MSVGAVTLCGMERELPLYPPLPSSASERCRLPFAGPPGRALNGHDQVQGAAAAGGGRCIPASMRPSPEYPVASARLWAAVLSAGPGAVAQLRDGAELHRLTDKPTETIHVTVPARAAGHGGRRASACTGRRGRSRPSQATRVSAADQVEETVLDLTQTATSFDDVCGWVTRRSRGSSPTRSRLRAAMTGATEVALARGPARAHRAAAGGDHSVLEFRYHRDVERAHGLPEPAAGAVRRRRPGGAGGGTACTRSTAWWWSSTGGWRTRPRTSGRTRPGTTPPPRPGSSRCGTAGRRSGGRPARPPRRWPGCSACTAGTARKPCSPGCPVQGRDRPGPAEVTAASTRAASVRSGRTTCAPAAARSAAA